MLARTAPPGGRARGERLQDARAEGRGAGGSGQPAPGGSHHHPLACPRRGLRVRARCGSAAGRLTAPGPERVRRSGGGWGSTGIHGPRGHGGARVRGPGRRAGVGERRPRRGAGDSTRGPCQAGLVGAAGTSRPVRQVRPAGRAGTRRPGSHLTAARRAPVLPPRLCAAVPAAASSPRDSRLQNGAAEGRAGGGEPQSRPPQSRPAAHLGLRPRPPPCGLPPGSGRLPPSGTPATPAGPPTQPPPAELSARPGSRSIYLSPLRGNHPCLVLSCHTCSWGPTWNVERSPESPPPSTPFLPCLTLSPVTAPRR